MQMATDEVLHLPNTNLERACQTGLPWRLMKPLFNVMMSSRSPAVRERSWDPALQRLSLPSPSGVDVTNDSCHASYQHLVTFYFIQFYLWFI
jgi:hypothetical protein